MTIPDWVIHPSEWGQFLPVSIAAVIGIWLLLRLVLRGARAFSAPEDLPAKSFRRVLVSAAPAEGFAEDTVALACRLAGSGGGPPASVLLACIVEVPRSLALDAPLPDDETNAAAALDAAAAVVRRFGLQPLAQVRRARTRADEVLRAAIEEKADLLVLAAPPRPRPAAGDPMSGAGDVTAALLSAQTREIARRAPCEVVLVRPGRPA